MLKQVVQTVLEFIASFEIYIGIRPKSQKDEDVYKKGEEILEELGIK